MILQNLTDTDDQKMFELIDRSVRSVRQAVLACFLGLLISPAENYKCRTI